MQRVGVQDRGVFFCILEGDELGIDTEPTATSARDLERRRLFFRSGEGQTAGGMKSCSLATFLFNLGI